jgi:hypothetical protein
MQTKDKIKLAVALVVLAGAGYVIYYNFFREPPIPTPEQRSGLDTPPATTTTPPPQGATPPPTPPKVVGPARGLYPGPGK